MDTKITSMTVVYKDGQVVMKKIVAEKTKGKPFQGVVTHIKNDKVIQEKNFKSISGLNKALAEELPALNSKKPVVAKHVVIKDTMKPAVESKGKHAVESKGKHAVESKAKPTVESKAKPTVESKGKHAVKSKGKHAVESKAKHAVESKGKHAVKRFRKNKSH